MADTKDKEDSTKEGGQESTPTQVVFSSQADVDAMIQKRIGRATETANAGFLEALGVDSIDALKATITKAGELEKAQMSDMEKASAENTTLQESLTTMTTERDNALSAAKLQSLKTAVSAAAQKAGFTTAADAWLYIADSEFYDADGKQDNEAIAAIIAKLAESKPYLLTPAEKQNFGSPIRKKKMQIPDAKNNGIVKKPRSVVRF